MNLSKRIALIGLLILSQCIDAQYQITIEANIIDEKTSQPIPFTEIIFKGKPIKTISDSNGKILLSYNETVVSEIDTIHFYALDYKPLKVSASQLYRLLNNTNVIYLKPLNTVDIDRGNSTSKGNVYGRITNNNGPIQHATVALKNSILETQTDSLGKFRINAKEDDILIIKYLGMKTKEIIVNKKEEINIELISDGELLDEVVLKGKSKKRTTINLGKNESKSLDELGYSVNTIDEKDIGSQYQNFQYLIRRIPGARVKPTKNVGEPPVIYFRNNNSANNEVPAIFDIDGNVYETWPNIEVQNIKNITILKSLASVTKYGTIGRGGVIVIRTKTASGGKAEPKKLTALASGNDYVEQIQSINTIASTTKYMQALQNANTFDEAEQTYKTIKQTKDNLSIPFYLNAAEYFLRWNKNYSLNLFSAIEDLAKDNVKALRTLAFKYEAFNKHDKARLVYQRIAILRPTDGQSYRDLALIYNATGYYNEAMQLYKQMLSNSIEGVDFSGLQQPIIDEAKHLLAFHRSKVNYNDLPADLLTAKFKQDLRIVFEWNDPNAEFELQFVNPQKKFFKWSHTKFDNRERMLDEIKKGYTTEAYIIDDAEPGEWIINIEALNEEPSINPNYLKYTIYKNYGLPNETKTVKVIQLENIKQKVTLDKFMYQ